MSSPELYKPFMAGKIVWGAQHLEKWDVCRAVNLMICVQSAGWFVCCLLMGGALSGWDLGLSSKRTELRFADTVNPPL